MYVYSCNYKHNSHQYNLVLVKPHDMELSFDGGDPNKILQRQSLVGPADRRFEWDGLQELVSSYVNRSFFFGHIAVDLYIHTKHTHTHIYIHICTFTVYIHIYIYIYKYIHIYIYT